MRGRLRLCSMWGLGRVSPSGERKGWERQDSLPIPSYLECSLYSLPFIHVFFPFASSSSLLLFLPSTATITSPVPSLLLPFAPSHQTHQQREQQHRRLPPSGAPPDGGREGWAASGPTTSSSTPKPSPRCPDSMCLQAGSSRRAPQGFAEGRLTSVFQDRAASSPLGTKALIQRTINYACSAGQDKTLFSVKP